MVKTRIFLHDHLTSFRAILISFVLLVLLGAFLLMLPISSSCGEYTSFIDALFTASSAACVTGLVIKDTATYWSTFGQIIILLLIQIGGLGVITIAITTLMFTGKRIGIMERSTMQDAISAPQIGGIVKLTRFIFMGTIFLEGVGAFLLSFVFVKDYGLIKGIGYGIFHSVSAYCNAGFDLIGINNSSSSLMPYISNPIINIVIPALIIVGGLGFFTWRDIIDAKFHFKPLRLQSKIILTTTLLLIILPFIYFFFVEFKSFTLGERVMASFFQSVTPRTAGFSTVNYGEMSEIGLIITILLMLVGGAPGSTAGGVKVTSLFVLFAFTISYLRQKDNVNCYRRRIEDKTIEYAIAVVFLYFFLLLMGAMIVSSIEKISFLPALFECASAIGTVGLSMGITSSLGSVSLLILITFMWFGRLGILTIAYAAVNTKSKVPSKLPSEKIIIG